MHILGQGHYGLVVVDKNKPDRVKKYYQVEQQWSQEKTNLRFVADIQKWGFKLDCKVPEVFDSTTGKWEINGKEYNFCNKMDLIPGITARSGNENSGIRSAIGTNLGELIFNMHTQCKTYIKHWLASFDKKDKLFLQIIHDKAGKVTKKEKDANIRNWVKEAKRYLQDKENVLTSQCSLSHQDLNLSNIMVDKNGHIKGLVDWAGFGWTNPTLSLYQLATKRNLWAYVKEAYENKGGKIDYGSLYAAATIHLAWAPIACKELGREKIDLTSDESKESLEQMYANFKKYKT